MLILALLLNLSLADLVSWRIFEPQSAPANQSRIARSADGTRLIVSWGQTGNENRTPVGRLLKVRPDDTVSLQRSEPGVSYGDVAAGPSGTFFVLGADQHGQFVFLLDRDVSVRWTRRIDYGDAVAIASDPAGNLLIAGRPADAFQPTAGALQTTLGEPACSGRHGMPVFQCSHAFVVKLGPDGRLAYATYLGGRLQETVTDIAAGPDGSAYVVGETTSTDFPTTSGSAQPTIGGVISLGPLSYGDGFLVRIAPDGKSLVYGTYLGSNSADRLNSVAVDSAGQALVAGWTQTDLTQMPGAAGETFFALFDGVGRITARQPFAAGRMTVSGELAIAPDGRFFSSQPGGNLYELSSETLQVVRAGYLSVTNPPGIVAAAGGSLHAVGTAGTQPKTSFLLPNVPWRLGQDFLATYDFNREARSFVSALANAASLGAPAAGQSAAQFAPNQIVTIFGLGLAAPVRVTLAGRELPIVFTADTQINALVPGDVIPGVAAISVYSGASLLGTWTYEVVPYAPALFTTVVQQAAALNEDGTVNFWNNPAAPGSIVQLFGTGLGATDAQGRLVAPIEAYGPGGPGGGMEILYAGAAPGLPGVAQVNVRVHPDTPPAVQSRAVPVKLVVGREPAVQTTQHGVFIYVR